MNYSTKRWQYWSFWWQIWSTHQNQEVIWVNRVVEVAEASEAAEADEVIEAVEVSKASKSLLRTSKLSRFLNSALFWFLEQFFFWWNHEKSWGILALFSISAEAIEARIYNFFINWFLKLKFHNLRMSEPPILACIFLSVRLNLLLTVHSETPCISWDVLVCQLFFWWFSINYFFW